MELLMGLFWWKRDVCLSLHHILTSYTVQYISPLQQIIPESGQSHVTHWELFTSYIIHTIDMIYMFIRFFLLSVYYTGSDSIQMQPD